MADGEGIQKAEHCAAPLVLDRMQERPMSITVPRETLRSFFAHTSGSIQDESDNVLRQRFIQWLIC